MRYFQIVLGVLMLAMTSCTDSSRAHYDIPNDKKIDKDHELKAILEHLSDRIKTNPSNPDNYYKRAHWHLKGNNLQDALIDITRAERLSPNSGEILYLKSKILSYSDKKEALENALFAEDQGYKTPDLYILIADLYTDKKDFSKANLYLQKAEEIYPYNGYLFNSKAKYFAYQGDTSSAISQYRRALLLQPHNFVFYDDLIKMYSEVKRIDSALVLNEAAIRKFPNKTELVFNKALILENLGLADSSIKVYRQFLNLEPRRYDVYEHMANIYAHHKNYGAAFNNYNKWAEAEPENPVPLLKATRCYVAMGNFPAAKFYINKALEKHPNNNELKAELVAINYRLDQISRGYYRTPTTPSQNEEASTEENQ